QRKADRERARKRAFSTCRFSWFLDSRRISRYTSTTAAGIHSGRKKRPKAARIRKRRNQNRLYRSKPGCRWKKDFLGSATSATSWRVLQYLILYALSRQSVKRKVQEIGASTQRTLTSRR